MKIEPLSFEIDLSKDVRENMAKQGICRDLANNLMLHDGMITKTEGRSWDCFTYKTELYVFTADEFEELISAIEHCVKAGIPVTI